MDPAPRYRRVLLKLSGEALMGAEEFGIDLDMAGRIADEVVQAVENGVQVALVIGGGNIFRGVAGAASAWIAPMQTRWACWQPS